MTQVHTVNIGGAINSASRETLETVRSEGTV